MAMTKKMLRMAVVDHFDCCHWCCLHSGCSIKPSSLKLDIFFSVGDVGIISCSNIKPFPWCLEPWTQKHNNLHSQIRCFFLNWTSTEELCPSSLFGENNLSLMFCIKMLAFPDKHKTWYNVDQVLHTNIWSAGMEFTEILNLYNIEFVVLQIVLYTF